MIYTSTKLWDAIEGLLNETGETVFILHFQHGAKYRRIACIGNSIKKSREMSSRIEELRKTYEEEMNKTVECTYDVEKDKLRVYIEANSERDYRRCEELLQDL